MDYKVCSYLYGVILITLTYFVCLISYRIFLSPLAKFPGPTLAAASGWYEAYFQLVKQGRFTWQIEYLHQKYGPVVRIKPNEVHVHDPDNYTTLYSGPTHNREKERWFYYTGLTSSLFSTADHRSHRARRSLISPFFTRKAVREFQPVLQEKLQSLCRHFSQSINCDATLELHAAFISFAGDAMSQYAFGEQRGFRFLDEPELTSTWKNGVNAMFASARLVRQFPFLYPLGHLIPFLSCLVYPSFRRTYYVETDQQDGKLDDEQKKRAIYPAMLANDKVPPSEKQAKRLQEDATFFMLAASDAPSEALAITSFHILDNPKVLRRLKDELFSAFPEVTSIPSLDELERLPYLTAVLREGLRLSNIVVPRQPRVAPDEVLQFHNWKIPPGTPVSMTIYHILRDPRIFPEPTKFNPERWLIGPEELRKLEKYLVPFSKGGLGCLGPNMAWAWLYLVIGTIFRRFDLVLYNTTRENVEMVQDNFSGQTAQGMNNVQVKVRRENL
ncbi:cytochrome P450 [Penicillium longicatenatum]|uniref:cytochrome P450 n=1 Tax=Penicillium longicatenatum TaxID=1561947 RepID=UPI00254838E9|nr:cytochrome P450 [Penicillium longicatenatum]KAJ5650559.1 cytochrome P450 [Penicillium longicatenatum]